jgi:hypothetical protein
VAKKKIDVAEFLDQLVKDSNGKLPHIGEVAQQFVHLAGGPQQMAALLWKEFSNAPQGSLARTQLFAMVCKIWDKATDALETTDPEGLSDEELNQEIRNVVLGVLRDAAQSGLLGLDDLAEAIREGSGAGDKGPGGPAGWPAGGGPFVFDPTVQPAPPPAERAQAEDARVAEALRAAAGPEAVPPEPE